MGARLGVSNRDGCEIADARNPLICNLSPCRANNRETAGTR
jgi:hypothetical protein